MRETKEQVNESSRKRIRMKLYGLGPTGRPDIDELIIEARKIGGCKTYHQYAVYISPRLKEPIPPPSSITEQ